jgi:hypothetical protein
MSLLWFVMDVNKVNSEVVKVKSYFNKEWKYHVDESFDKTFSLRNWTVILALLKLNNKKKVLHIGSGPGYFLQVLKDQGINAVGVEPFCVPVDGKIEVYKNQIQDILDKDSELSKKLKCKKFDAIVAHDVFTESVMFDKTVVNQVINKLKELNAMLILGFTNEAPLFWEENLIALNNGFDKIQGILIL